MAVNLKHNLNRIMKAQGMKLARLESISKVPKATIHGWMTSESQEKINVKQLQKVCDALKVPMYELLFSLPDPFEKREIGTEILKELFTGDIRVSLHKIERK